MQEDEAGDLSAHETTGSFDGDTADEVQAYGWSIDYADESSEIISKRPTDPPPASGTGGGV